MKRSGLNFITESLKLPGSTRAEERLGALKRKYELNLKDVKE